jgi:hypothetical protein
MFSLTLVLLLFLQASRAQHQIGEKSEPRPLPMKVEMLRAMDCLPSAMAEQLRDATSHAHSPHREELLVVALQRLHSEIEAGWSECHALHHAIRRARLAHDYAMAQEQAVEPTVQDWWRKAQEHLVQAEGLALRQCREVKIDKECLRRARNDSFKNMVVHHMG